MEYSYTYIVDAPTDLHAREKIKGILIKLNEHAEFIEGGYNWDLNRLYLKIAGETSHVKARKVRRLLERLGPHLSEASKVWGMEEDAPTTFYIGPTTETVREFELKDLQEKMRGISARIAELTGTPEDAGLQAPAA